MSDSLISDKNLELARKAVLKAIESVNFEGSEQEQSAVKTELTLNLFYFLKPDAYSENIQALIDGKRQSNGRSI